MRRDSSSIAHIQLKQHGEKHAVQQAPQRNEVNFSCKYKIMPREIVNISGWKKEGYRKE